jgi:[ribosomal protein S5]-alanine N-acetyltransferase
MELIPVKRELKENTEFINDPLCKDTLQMTIDFYKKVGFIPPWICYYIKQDGNIVGSGGFKGPPVGGKIEIAYGTFEGSRKQGIGTEICKKLVNIALETDPFVRITARTLPENNFSNRVLEKNNFRFICSVDDPEDGNVWEWEYAGNK